jgi:hypothetical protein
VSQRSLFPFSGLDSLRNASLPCPVASPSLQPFITAHSPSVFISFFHSFIHSFIHLPPTQSTTHTTTKKKKKKKKLVTPPSTPCQRPHPHLPYPLERNHQRTRKTIALPPQSHPQALTNHTVFRMLKICINAGSKAETPVFEPEMLVTSSIPYCIDDNPTHLSTCSPASMVIQSSSA